MPGVEEMEELENNAETETQVMSEAIALEAEEDATEEEETMAKSDSSFGFDFFFGGESCESEFSSWAKDAKGKCKGIGEAE